MSMEGPGRKKGEVMIPSQGKREAAFDPKRLCERCWAPISRERQENALYIGRYPKYCSDVCAHRAASARYYERRGSALHAHKLRLKAARKRAGRKKKTVKLTEQGD